MSALALGLTASAYAGLSSSYQFNGTGNWSLSAVGSNSNPVGNLQAYVPTGSTVEKAFLYSAIYTGSMGNVSLGSTIYNGSSFTALGTTSTGQSAFRVDVTAQMKTAIGSGSASTFNFSVNEFSNGSTDGEILAIVYSNAAEQERTIAFLDGTSAQSGDTTTVNLGDPLTKVGDPSFEALVSLGIGYSYQYSGQYSQIDINGRRLTTSAGGQDDGGGFNGGLITAGGLGDNSANPADPYATDSAGPRSDDELYNLAKGNGVDANPFLSNGMTSFTVNTLNPSQDDNIFFLGLNMTARAGVNQPPPPPPPTDRVPDAASTFGMFLLGLLGLGALRRRS